MKCLRCGNQLNPEEVFCRQCGSPVSTKPPFQNTPLASSSRSGLLKAYNPVPSTPAPSSLSEAAIRKPATGQLLPSNRQTGFYRDETEAISLAPESTQSPSAFPGYPQQGLPRTTPSPYSTPGQPVSQMHPFQAGSHNGSMPPQQHPFATGQGYNYGPQGSVTPQKQSGNPIVLVVCITLVIVLIGAVTITTLVLLNHPAPNQAATVTTPTAAPTVAPTPSPTSQPSPTAIPSPTIAPTPAPDTGFAWCGPNCSQYSFMTEFPAAWQGSPAVNSQGVQFEDPTTPGVYASFKAPGATATSATDVLTNDLQTNFASQPGYTAPTPPPAANATIGGAPWYEVATSYNDNQGQPVHIEVYATVYQGKAYIIELQSPNGDNQFDTVKQQSFENMLVKFQFLPTAQ